MLAAQNYVCPICSRVIVASAHRDHDHKTDALRGYLCRNCNLGLGNFHDDSVLIRQAAAYQVHNELLEKEVALIWEF